MEINKPISETYNEDNMLGMKRYPDKYFQLAIVDPPYGLDMAKERPRRDGRFAHNKPRTWDRSIPSEAYFNELFRVTKNQIIWGANYYGMPAHQGWICWDKGQPVDNFSDGEFAYTSFERPAKIFRYKYYGNLSGKTSAEPRIHISQKPIALYKWLLKNYAKPGDKILDTHLGSMSSRIAAYHMGFDFWGYEIDKEYFDAGNKRFIEQTMQLSLL